MKPCSAYLNHVRRALRPAGIFLIAHPDLFP